MKYIYFDGKHVNKDKIHYVEEVNTCNNYRIYLGLGEDSYYFEEIFDTEEQMNARYDQILGELIY